MNIRTKVLAGLLALSGIAVPARAGTTTFDFNNLSDGATDGQVQTYMNTALGAAGSVSVTGAVASDSYTGDNHAVGPKSEGTVTPLTLANTDGSTTPNSSGQHLGSLDTFIMNSTANGYNDIFMQFAGLTITSVSFDLEIFPDGTCPNPSSGNSGVNKGCTSTSSANWPDFKFKAGGTLVNTWLGVAPGQNGTYKDSPALTGGETAPQLLTTSGIWNFPLGVTSLDFVDWPATIGIDNLQITYDCPGILGCPGTQGDPPASVPTPASLPLLGTGLFLVWVMRRRFASQA